MNLSRIGLDLAKQVFQVHGVDRHEHVVCRRQLKRAQVRDFFRQLPPCLVAMEACGDVFLRPQHPTTRRFVFEAERVDEDERHDDFAHVPGLILRLTFRGEATYAPLLGTVARQTGVDYSILSGRIDRIKDTPYGQLTLALVGGDLEAAMSQLNAADVHVEVLR